MRIITLFVLMITLSAWARPNPLLVCLGKEEQKIHTKKISGPYETLNQSMISNLIQLPKNIYIKNKYLKVVCSKSNLFPSISLLEILLKQKKSAFLIKTTTDREHLIANNIIDDVVAEFPEVFITFVTNLQTLAPDPKCLEREIPPLTDLYLKLKYVRDKMSTEQIFKSAGSLNKIFDKFHLMDEIIESCKRYNKRKKLSPKNT